MSQVVAACLLLCAESASAQPAAGEIACRATVTANTGNSEIAPYYITSGRGGTITQRHSALASVAVEQLTDTTRRLSWGFGGEVWAGYSSSADYSRYDAAAGQFLPNAQHPARVWLQQLYAEGKYRGVFVTVGAKQHGSPLLNGSLSSGDMVMSGNARPGAGAAAGFVNFQNIPFTRTWNQGMEKCLGVAAHLHLLLQLAALIQAVVAAKLACGLHAYGEHHAFGGLGAEICVFVV